MKTETKLTLLFFAGCLSCLMLAIRFTPTKQPSIEDVLNSDTSQVNHSEIKVQELSETYLYYHQLESEREYKFDPKYLNND